MLYKEIRQKLLELEKLMEGKENLSQKQTAEDMFYEDLQQINPYYTRYRYSDNYYE